MTRPVDGPGVPGASDGGASPYRNGLGIVSLILGVVALGTSWLVIGVPFGIAALAVGLAARARVTRGEANNRGIAISGMALGVLAIVVDIAVVAVHVLYFSHHVCESPAGSPPC